MGRFVRLSPHALWIGAIFIAAPLVAGPVYHEKFAPNPEEDLRLGATTPSGSMPAAIKTRSGVVAAPNEAQGAQQQSQGAYGGNRTPTSADANYHVDRLTTRPARVQYDEPFRPSILPFKRSYAFDLLQDDLSFGVADKTLNRVSVGGTAEEREDVFFGDMNVDLVAGVPVRIPSVGPGARVRAMHVDPPQPLEILEDSAENWFVRAQRGGRVRIVLQLSIDRQVFGSGFLPVSWARLAPFVSPLPESVAPMAAAVAAHVGVSRRQMPSRVLVTLVQYFRKFHESSELPQAESAQELYKELSLEQKGVCRHRSYAFAVTAISLGLPTRLVHNEAHAWVEVFDSELWHRIDLGGAASDIQESRPDPLTPNHRPPHDPHSWPADSHPGSGQRTPPDPSGAHSFPAGEAPTTNAPESPVEETSSAGAKPSAWPSAGTSTTDSSVLESFPGSEAPEIFLRVAEEKILRGSPLAVSGSARRLGRVCSLSRIDIFVESPEGPIGIGSVATDRRGRFSGQVTLPQSTPVGPLEITASVAEGCQ